MERLLRFLRFLEFPGDFDYVFRKKIENLMNCLPLRRERRLDVVVVIVIAINRISLIIIFISLSYTM